MPTQVMGHGACRHGPHFFFTSILQVWFGSVMNFDQYNLIIQDPPSNDGGDTCNRMGDYYMLDYILNYEMKSEVGQKMLNTATNRYFEAYLLLTDKNHWFRRHPTQEPWNNVRNCTRDQIEPWLVTLALRSANLDCTFSRRWLKVQFWNMVKRFWFYQNFDRDYPGTKKSLLPQIYKAGQRFDDRTRFTKTTIVWKPNFADFAGITVFGHFIRGLRIYWLYPLLYIVDGLNLLTALTYCKSEDYEDQRLLRKLALGKAVMPTIFNWFAIYVMRNWRIYGGKTWMNLRISTETIRNVCWYYRGDGETDSFKNCDSKDFQPLWIEFGKWLFDEKN